MTISFNLTTCPWIPCEDANGRVVELSTHDTLVRAHELRAIVNASPLVVGVLHRHLLAVLHRVVEGPATVSAWTAVAKAGRLDAQRIGKYLTQVQGRMDLFHPATPFAQVSGLKARFNVDPIDQLTVERSSWGTARELFQHRPADYAATMTYAEAARGLLVHHAFATGGLVKKPGEPTSATAAPLVRLALIVLRGETLFKTLLSNLLIYDRRNDAPVPAAADDAPTWELPPQPEHLLRSDEPKEPVKGWLHMLTWLSRRLELVERDGQVVGYVRAVGQGTTDEMPRDPMGAYRRDEKRGWLAIGLHVERAFWRNANALFHSSAEEGRDLEKPKAMGLVSKPEIMDVLGERAIYTIDVFGIAAEKSRVDLVRAEHLHASARVFEDPASAENVRAALSTAEDVVRALRAALFLYARHALSAGNRDPETKDKNAFVDSLNAIPSAWGQIGVAFEELLSVLDRDGKNARVHFQQTCVSIVERHYRIATSGSDGRASSLKGRSVGESLLGYRLREVAREWSPVTEARAQEQAQ